MKQSKTETALPSITVEEKNIISVDDLISTITDILCQWDGKSIVDLYNKHIAGTPNAKCIDDNTIELFDITSTPDISIPVKDEGLQRLIDLKENERKAWADLCIKKQVTIEQLYKALQKVDCVLTEQLSADYMENESIIEMFGIITAALTNYKP